MRLIKQLHLFVLKSFLPLFAMTFFIVLFIVLMQFLWKYIDDLVGKGLSFDVLCELFFYAAVSMVPMALPLAILLASLMTFGNFGEKFELTAMKASGISLIRVMAPLIVLISGVAVGAFFFQNNVLPHAQVKMWTLLFSMRQKSPELEIPEGVFYDQIPGYNIFVAHKNRETGMLHDVMIYDVSHGGDNGTILLADSTRLSFTKDLKYLYLHLFKGEQFENLQEQSLDARNIPFRREEFLEKEVLIPFDANFNRLDEEGMRKQYVGKNIKELRQTVDSVNLRIDSLGAVYSEDVRLYAVPLLRRYDDTGFTQGSNNTFQGKSTKVEETAAVSAISIDSILGTLAPQRQRDVLDAARSISSRRMGEVEFKSLTLQDEKKTIRRHEIELIKKFTLSVACLIFFFIGAPLGAIIRKGGIGTPLVISVLLFLVYYIIDNTGYKMARDGRWPVWFGMWLSTFVLAPLGGFVTYKAMSDSAVFNPDLIKDFVRKLFGVHGKRYVAFKEVVMNDYSGRLALALTRDLKYRASAIYHLYRKESFIETIRTSDAAVKDMHRLGDSLDFVIDYLNDSSDRRVVGLLSEFPVIFPVWIYRFNRRRMFKDLTQIVKLAAKIEKLLDNDLVS